MNKRLVVGCFGDAASIDLIARHAATAEVIAVVIDLSGALTPGDARDAALAAGAARCHVLDVREAFLRDVIIPALPDADPADVTSLFLELAPGYVTSRLRDIAGLENADWAPVSLDAIRAMTAAQPRTVVAPSHLDITVHEGVPTAVNGVELSLAELVDSLEVITGQPALPLLAARLRAHAILSDQMAEVGDHQLA